MQDHMIIYKFSRDEWQADRSLICIKGLHMKVEEQISASSP